MTERRAMTTLTTRSPSNGHQSGQDLLEQLVPGRVPGRRNWSRVGAGLALAIASGAVFVALYASAGARHPFLAITKPVTVGQTITAADLTTVRLAAAPPLSPVPADEASGVIGRRAAVALVPGTLLTPGDLASGPLIGRGDASVGLDLKPGQVPLGLTPEALVAVVETGAPGSSQPPTAGSASPASLGSAQMVLAGRAVVLSVVLPTTDSATGNTEVTVAVAADAAPAVATAASAGQVALVELGSGEGSP